MSDAKREQFEGKAKEVVGKVTGDKRTEAEGAAQKEGGKAKEVIDNAKETIKGAIDGIKDAFDNKDEQ